MKLAAALRWCDVTSTDYVESLLERGRARAEAEGLRVKFQIADAEDLSFADGSFDAVVSIFGGMFSPDQDRTAAEMIRVWKLGGKAGLANWTPEGFIGHTFKTVGIYLPAPTGEKSPAFWGTRSFVETTFGATSSEIAARSRISLRPRRSAREYRSKLLVEVGPEFDALDPGGCPPRVKSGRRRGKRLSSALVPTTDLGRNPAQRDISPKPVCQ
jgi:Methyltransferase domain